MQQSTAHRSPCRPRHCHILWLRVAQGRRRRRRNDADNINNNDNNTPPYLPPPLHVQIPRTRPEPSPSTRLTRSTASAAADVRATILLGGILRDIGNTTAASTSTTTTTINDLLNWQASAHKDSIGLKATVDEIRADSKRNKKIQTERPLFETSTVILAQYFQAGITVRNELFWKSNRIPGRPAQ